MKKLIHYDNICIINKKTLGYLIIDVRQLPDITITAKKKLLKFSLSTIFTLN